MAYFKKRLPAKSDILTYIQSTLFICLFSCRHNPLWLYFHSPVAGFSLLVFEVT